jgi:protein-S-isoprenylcysteine O-methyltransferase Ste14
MLLCAITAFVALPGIVAFALPIEIGISTHHPVRYVPLAATVLAEPWAARHFGAEWDAYRAKVSRWIGTRSPLA